MTEATSITRSMLKGRHILVVEDEYMIAEEIALALSEAGAEAVGPVAHVDDALRLVASEPDIDCALLDVNLHDEAIWPVVDALLARDVPLVLASGYEASEIPAANAHLPRRQKPITGRELTFALAQALSSSASRVERKAVEHR
jgi:DNA-binding response OmpR family regulator